MNWFVGTFVENEWLVAFLALFFGILLSAFPVCWWVVKGKCLLKQRKYLNLVKERLEFYALLQNESINPDCDDKVIEHIQYAPIRPFLTSSSHKILLGVLKKIEAKNGVVLAITILLLGGMISISPTVMSSHPLLENGYLLIIGFLVGPLVSAIDGAGHLGQPQYVRLAERKCSRDAKTAKNYRLKLMQKQLIVDLVAKEYAFQIRIWTTGLAILMVVAFLYFLLIVC